MIDKICIECGLKAKREENLVNIDFQIRAKLDIHEGLFTGREGEYMEGDEVMGNRETAEFTSCRYFSSTQCCARGLLL